ncbi:hypothetical protein HYZ64_02795 [Candidatus Berkelbacteria bacterium]|nr:hypothetical protein [Candidatus Berkelbacteria bacterium]
MKPTGKRALPLGLGLAVLFVALAFWSSNRRPNQWQAEIIFDFPIPDSKADRCQINIGKVLDLIWLLDKLEKKQANPELTIIVTRDIEAHFAMLGHTLAPGDETEWQLYSSLIMPATTGHVLYIDYGTVRQIDLFGQLAHQWEHLHDHPDLYPTGNGELVILRRTIVRLRKISLMLNEVKRLSAVRKGQKPARDELAEQITKFVIPSHEAIYRALNRQVQQPPPPTTLPPGSAFRGSFL